MDDHSFRLGDHGRYPTSLNMSQYTKIIEAIAEQTDGEFRAASKEDLASLEGLGLPSTVLDFFAEHEPDGCIEGCLLYTSPSPRDATLSRMPSSA